MFLQAGFLLFFLGLCHNYPQYYNHDEDNDYYYDNQSQDNNGNGYDYGVGYASNADQLASTTATAGTYSQNFGGGLSYRLSYGSSGNPYEQNFQQNKKGFYLRRG